MTTSPSLSFKNNLEEVMQLLNIHVQLTGNSRGRRHKVEVLNKSAIIFTCASFEAFIEDTANRAFEHITSNGTDYNNVPNNIKKSIANSLKEDKNELAIWALAEAGWKNVLMKHKIDIMHKHTGPFNTPKPGNIDQLFKDLIGLQNISSTWKWSKIKPETAKEKLKIFVETRGGLAHGEKPAPIVTKADVKSYLQFLAILSVKISNSVREYCFKQTQKYPWPAVQYNKIE